MIEVKWGFPRMRRNGRHIRLRGQLALHGFVTGNGRSLCGRYMGLNQEISSPPGPGHWISCGECFSRARNLPTEVKSD